MAADANEAAKWRELPNLGNVCQKYHGDDIWNADYTGVYYGILHDRKIPITAMQCRKKEVIDSSYLCQWIGMREVSAPIYSEFETTEVR